MTETLPIALIILGLAGFIFWNTKQSRTRPEEIRVTQTEATVIDSATRGDTGVARYLKRLPSPPVETGVAKYIRNLAKPAIAEIAEIAETGVTRYIRNMPARASKTNVSRYLNNIPAPARETGVTKYLKRHR